MNKANIKKLRDFIETLPEDAVRMRKWLKPDRDGETVAQALKHTCGTQGCIAGWGSLVMLKEQRRWNCKINPIVDRLDEGDFQDVRRWLGLSFANGHKLFHGEWCGTQQELCLLSKRDVLKQLDYMLRTGTV